MAYDENLAERIRVLLSDVPGVTERRMFGGLAFMVNGNMACGPVKDLLMVRVGKDQYGAALHEGPATEMTFTGRPMKGFVQIQTDALADDDVLADWVHRG
ncbi:MAG: TfoX/Sxy family protein, partial [Candidatus Nanopelagicales bacterium]|nr:TfoX/Sxy family protein [Candidatus Nanopelagicales bacterium]